jgi:hypothetical protein
MELPAVLAVPLLPVLAIQNILVARVVTEMQLARLAQRLAVAVQLAPEVLVVQVVLLKMRLVLLLAVAVVEQVLLLLAQLVVMAVAVMAGQVVMVALVPAGAQVLLLLPQLLLVRRVLVVVVVAARRVPMSTVRLVQPILFGLKHRIAQRQVPAAVLGAVGLVAVLGLLACTVPVAVLVLLQEAAVMVHRALLCLPTRHLPAAAFL